ncbi:MAG: rhomboid family intramembrane serine protease [Spirochaetes bacterium]|nr:rhomboid family intramembrane serine protease [Spirochaetota bacterium]
MNFNPYNANRKRSLPATYIIIGINVAVYLLCNILVRFGIVSYDFIIRYFSLVPYYVYKNFMFWQFLTHFFIHDIASMGHIFFNMFALLMFGIPLERMWGSKKFTTFYLLSGIFTGVLSSLIYTYTYTKTGVLSPMIGASGAIYAIMVGFAFTFPNAVVLVMFVLPMKAKYLPVVFFAMDLIAEFSGGKGNVAHWGHLSGILVGFILFAIMFKMIRVKVSFTKSPGNKQDARSMNPAKGATKGKMSGSELTFFINMCLYKLKNNIVFSPNEINTLKNILDKDKRDVISLCNTSDFDLSSAKCSSCRNLLNCIYREIKNRQGIPS